MPKLMASVIVVLALVWGCQARRLVAAAPDPTSWQPTKEDCEALIGVWEPKGPSMAGLSMGLAAQLAAQAVADGETVDSAKVYEEAQKQFLEGAADAWVPQYTIFGCDPATGMVAVLEVLRDTTKEGSPVSEVEWMMGWAAVQPTGTLKIEARGAQPGPGDPYNGGEVIFYYRPDSMVAVRTALDVSTEEWPTPNGRATELEQVGAGAAAADEALTEAVKEEARLAEGDAR